MRRSMTPEDWLDFLSKLVKLTSHEEKKRFAMSFLNDMNVKYGGQFALNGVHDELIALLARLEVGKSIDLQDGGSKDGD